MADVEGRECINRLRPPQGADATQATRETGRYLNSEFVMLDRLDDTIVAISSAPGYSELGIVRLSGPGAISIVDRMATVEGDASLASQPGSTRISGEVLIDDERSLPATFYLFRAPHSYTRQDLVEIHTVGSVAALELVRRRAIELGAVPAEPGEFTARAFLNGAMNLGEAEAVAGIIRARTDTQLRASRRLMDSTSAERTLAIRSELAALLALVEADIDFAEEPIEFITPAALGDRLGAIADRLRCWLTDSVSVERFDVLPHILLLGPPNAGKSTLMNRLSGTSRAICAAAAGTTRDILTAPVRLDRTEAILLDSAGVDRSEDEIIVQARELAMETAQQVDLTCVVIDLNAGLDEHFFHLIDSLDLGTVVIAANKVDLVTSDRAGALIRRLEGRRDGGTKGRRDGGTEHKAMARNRVCPVSATKGTGIAALQSALAEAIGSTPTTTLAESVLVSERQRVSICEASDAVARAISLSETMEETIDSADVVAFELREALDALGSIAGAVTTEDLLARVFADFCIGK